MNLGYRQECGGILNTYDERKKQDPNSTKPWFHPYKYPPNAKFNYIVWGYRHRQHNYKERQENDHHKSQRNASPSKGERGCDQGEVDEGHLGCWTCPMTWAGCGSMSVHYIIICLTVHICFVHMSLDMLYSQYRIIQVLRKKTKKHINSCGPQDVFINEKAIFLDNKKEIRKSFTEELKHKGLPAFRSGSHREGWQEEGPFWHQEGIVAREYTSNMDRHIHGVGFKKPAPLGTQRDLEICHEKKRELQMSARA